MFWFLDEHNLEGNQFDDNNVLNAMINSFYFLRSFV